MTQVWPVMENTCQHHSVTLLTLRILVCRPKCCTSKWCIVTNDNNQGYLLSSILKKLQIAAHTKKVNKAAKDKEEKRQSGTEEGKYRKTTDKIHF